MSFHNGDYVLYGAERSTKITVPDSSLHTCGIGIGYLKKTSKLHFKVLRPLAGNFNFQHGNGEGAGAAARIKRSHEFS